MSDETKIIPIIRRNGDRFECKVDADDFDWLRWIGTWGVTVGWPGKFYASSNTPRARRFLGNNKRVLMHRLLLGLTGKELVDHANGNGLDNRRANIRIATASDNKVNAHCSNPLGFRGIHKNASSFVAMITKHRKPRYLGSFSTAIEAARAYDRAAIELHGEFAVLNFPNDYAKAGAA